MTATFCRKDSFIVQSACARSAHVVWKIAKFSSTGREADERLKSPRFRLSDATWMLFVYPNGRRIDNTVGRVGIYLKKICSPTQEHTAGVKFTIPNNGGSCVSHEGKHSFRNGLSWGFRKALIRDEVLRKHQEFLLGGSLTIQCDITIQENNAIDFASLFPSASMHLKNDEEALYDNLTSLSKDFETLYNCQAFTDVTLIVGERKFPVHKCVLRCRSEAFASMLEDQQDTIDLTEMAVNTVQDMLRYIYCGKVRYLCFPEALSLYAAADRYDLHGLLIECGEVMRRYLSITNVCDVYLLASTRGDCGLLNAVKSFVSNNRKTLLKTHKWRLFSKNNSYLSLRLLEQIILDE